MTVFFRSILLAFIALPICNLNGQALSQSNYCGTETPSQQWESLFQELVSKNKSENNTAKKQAQVFTIPVIIHVIHGGQAVGQYPNLSQGQLNSQIRVLNDDFGGLGYNSGNYNPQAFFNWANAQGIAATSIDAFGRIKIANCNIQFCLATTDTLGNPLAEPGIERINYVSRGWTNPASITNNNTFTNLINGTIKPQTIWNVSKYLNIWITDENINAMGLLGYATFPPLTGLQGLASNFYGTSTTDGFWCYARAFGSVDYFPGGFYFGSNTRGRTSTHEIGHYLGLRHIWGDGNCANDYCDDTPPASDKNFNAPVYPFKIGGCSGNSPDGEMFMNFMDYTNDNIKYMYTEDQSLRIQTAMLNSPYRQFLGTHNLCSVAPIAAVSKFNLPEIVCGSAAVTMSNQTFGTPVPNFTWNVSGPAIISPNANSQIAAILFQSAGIYTVTLTADNGTLSTMSKTLTVYQPNLQITGYNAVECLGREVTLTATGGNSYSWTPFGDNSIQVSFQAVSDYTFGISMESDGGCLTSTVISITTMDCTDIGQISATSNKYSVFPNPASQLVAVQIPTGLISQIKIVNVQGKLIMDLETPANVSTVYLNSENLNAGLYFVEFYNDKEKVKTLKLIRE